MNAAQLLDFTFAGEPDIRDKQSPWSYFDSHLWLVHRPFISNLAFPSSRLVGPVSTVALTDIVQLLLQKNELHTRLKVLQRHCTVVVLVSTWQIKALGESKAEKFFRVHL